MAEPKLYSPLCFSVPAQHQINVSPTDYVIPRVSDEGQKTEVVMSLSWHPLQISSFGGTLCFCTVKAAAFRRVSWWDGGELRQEGILTHKHCEQVSQRKSKRRALVRLFVFATLTPPPLFELWPNSTWVCAGGLNLRARSNDQKCIVQ